MVTNLLAGYLFPHPPIMIPEIGGKEVEKIRVLPISCRASKILMNITLIL